MLELKNINVTAQNGDNRIQILKDINLRLEEKKIYVMTGPNGGENPPLPKQLWGFTGRIQGKSY